MDRGAWLSYNPLGHKESVMTEHLTFRFLSLVVQWLGLNISTAGGTTIIKRVL